MKHLHTLTALLAITATLPRAGEGPTDKKDDGERRLTADEWAAQERERLGKLSADKLVDELVKVKGENYDLRRRTAPDGGTVLNAEERARWEAWEKLGKPEDVSKAIDQGKKDREFVVRQEKREHLNTVAAAAGWDADTFADLDGMAGGLEWRVQEITKGEEKVQQVEVKQGDTWQTAETYAEARWKKFMPVLQAGESKGPAETDSSTVPTVHTSGRNAGSGKFTLADADKALPADQYSM